MVLNEACKVIKKVEFKGIEKIIGEIKGVQEDIEYIIEEANSQEISDPFVK